MQTSFPIAEKTKHPSLPIYLLTPSESKAWLKSQSTATRRWLDVCGYKDTAGTHHLLPAPDGSLAGVVYGVGEELGPWSIAALATQLPPLHYHLEASLSPLHATQLALGWALACYRFTRYKKSDVKTATLIKPDGCDMAYVTSAAASIYWARDLINTPANDMHPAALAEAAAAFAQDRKAKLSVLKGDALLAADYPLIHAVGKASATPPHLVDMRFVRKGAPKVTLVGKGVCFDTGGLDLKNAGGMRLMKKDMGGAACVLALAKMILDAKLPVQLRVLLPIVENAVSGSAMRPLDIITARGGKTVEIGNTDAEGRLILCEALAEADAESPDLLIDCATLTGAARVALGADMPAFFTPDDALAAAVMKHSAAQSDPLWRLPLWKPYRSQLDCPYADISNDPDSSYGGAITAALFLKEFVTTSHWLHIDMMAWNQTNKPGRPQGGEAMAVRALYELIKERYA